MNDSRSVIARASFTLLVVLVVFLADKGQITGDGLLRWEALRAIAERGELTDAKYTLAQPVLAMPLWWLGEATLAGDAVDPDTRAEAVRKVVQRFNKIIALLILVWVFRTMRRGFGVRDIAAGAAVLFVLFGSMLIPHARDFYSEPSWTLFLLVFLGALARAAAPDGALRAWGAAAAAIVPAAWLNPTLLVVLGGTWAAALWIRLRADPAGVPGIRRPTLLGLGAAAASVGILLGENALRRGDPMHFGYEGESFSTPILAGLAGMLVSPARGIVFFVPALVPAALAARRPPPGFGARFATLAAVAIALLILVYARWHAWHGALYWGPRFLLPLSVLAPMFLVAGLARGRVSGAIAIAAIVLSFLVHKDGVAIGQHYLSPCYHAHPPRSSECYWKWEFLPFASYARVEDLRRMATHRSTAVEAVALLAVAGGFVRRRGRTG